jgi:hypothetical protein
MLPDHPVSVSTQNVFDGKIPIRFSQRVLNVEGIVRRRL